MSTRRVYSVLTVVFSVFMICGTAAAAVYELSPSDSSYYQGCAGLCKCPVIFVGHMEGTFELELNPLPTSSSSQYRVTDIFWNVTNFKGKVVHKITGGGIYQVDEEQGVHQLMLDLTIDRTLIYFDSGLIPNESKFPSYDFIADVG